MNRDLNIAIYGDGGCCGCNESKRIKMFYALAVICIVIGLILMISGTSEDTKGTAGGLIGLGVIWGICGFCCPNGCCGEYKNNNQLLDWLYILHHYIFIFFIIRLIKYKLIIPF